MNAYIWGYLNMFLSFLRLNFDSHWMAYASTLSYWHVSLPWQIVHSQDDPKEKHLWTQNTTNTTIWGDLGVVLFTPSTSTGEGCVSQVKLPQQVALTKFEPA